MKQEVIVPNAEQHTGIENAVILVESEIEAGQQRIVQTLANFGMGCTESYYEPVYFDEHGESQGGWGCTLTDFTRDKLRVCDWPDLRGVGMISGDCIESMLDNIRDTGNRMRRRAVAVSASRTDKPATRTVRLELTLAEYDSLKSKAGGQSIQDYVKRKLL